MFQSFVSFLILSFSVITFAGSITNLDLSDVSVLLPLPTVSNWNQLPGPQTKAAHGELLPLKYFKKIPQLVGAPTNEMLYPDLRVVGVRFDPCFHEGSAPLQCKQQIRMVYQPLKVVQGVTSTFDASLHVFYELTPESFKDLLIALSQLKAKKSSSTELKPLTVNPFLKTDGLSSDYAKNLFELIFAHTGEAKLTRITFMQLFMNEIIWDFGGFDIAGGEMTVITIPRVNTRLQRFVNQATKPAPVWFFGHIVPAPSNDENLNLLIADSRDLGPNNETQIIEATRAAFRFENPRIHNPGTVDCVSCHVAQPARRWSVRQFPWLDLDRKLAADVYTSDKNLFNVSPMQVHTNIIRAFGYFMNQPVVAQRTINESAEVLKFIEQNY